MEDLGPPWSCRLNESAAVLQIEPQAAAVELQTLLTAALGQPEPPSPSTLVVGQKLCFSLGYTCPSDLKNNNAYTSLGHLKDLLNNM